MDRHPRIRQIDGAAAPGFEDMHMRHRRQLPGDATFRIMISPDDEHPDIPAGQPVHLLVKKQPGAEIIPVAVIEIAGNQQRLDLALDRQIDQGDQRTPGGRAQRFDRRAFMSVQPAQRTVEMQIRRMKKTPAHRCK
ncbi:hypothetical protein ABIC99_003236 [Sphaerotilus sulfidivorans]|uniref:Uncharacterized protein n=1 Tax=Sphaerotilus sulfidivorans TaxID=639200 RepID=A0ABV2IT99_9BURK